MSMFVFVIIIAGHLSGAFHIYDIETNPVLKRDAESLLMSSAVSATDQHREPPGTRLKRYTDYQENALAICCGECMYRLKTIYSRCYDLCNWNGRGPSPWELYEQQQQQQQQRTPVTEGLQTNDIHRMLTPRIGQRKTATGSNTGRRPTGGRRKMRVGTGRKGDRPGRQRNAGSRRKTIRNGNETCSCVCRS